MTEQRYVFDDKTIEAYTCGDCWHLGLVLHQMTGLPVVFAIPPLGEAHEWWHVGVFDGEHVIDVEGLTPVDLWQDRWVSASGSLRITDDPLPTMTLGYNESRDADEDERTFASLSDLEAEFERAFPEHDTFEVASRIVDSLTLPSVGAGRPRSLFWA